MSSKAGNPAKDFRRMNAPTVGPGIKSMGTRMRLQHAKGYSNPIWATSRENMSSGFRSGKTQTSLLSYRDIILDTETRGIILSRKWTTKALIRLSDLHLLFPYCKKQVFSWCDSYLLDVFTNECLVCCYSVFKIFLNVRSWFCFAHAQQLLLWDLQKRKTKLMNDINAFQKFEREAI